MKSGVWKGAKDELAVPVPSRISISNSTATGAASKAYRRQDRADHWRGDDGIRAVYCWLGRDRVLRHQPLRRRARGAAEDPAEPRRDGALWYADQGGDVRQR